MSDAPMDPPSPAATIAAPGTVERVILFEDRAEVTRRARVTLPAGTHWISVEGLAVAVDDSSLSAATSAAGTRALGARVRRQARAQPAASAEELATLEGALSQARAQTARSMRGLQRSQAEEVRLEGLLARWAQAIERVPKGGAAELARWRAAYAAIDAALIKSLDEASAREGELEEARREERLAELRLVEARALSPRYEAAAEVQLEIGPGAAGRPTELVITYRTPLALWRPEHTARLVPGPGGAGFELELRTVATVWQRTGEAWREVRCRFSTARPAQGASPPLLTDDPLRLRRRQERAVEVEARDQAITAAGLERGSRAVEEMPGVDDGGEPLAFEAPHPVTLPGDGQPYRVDLGVRRMPCEVDVVIYPERGDAAHVRATATLATGGPLLAGPVRLARGASMVGRGKTGFVAAGEPFDLGFGVDDGLRVRRRIDEARETTPVTGTQKLTRTVKLYVSNLGGATRQAKVIERVPVSELGDVTVRVTERGGATVDDDGFARFDVELPPGGTRELTLVYRIEAGAKVRLPF